MNHLKLVNIIEKNLPKEFSLNKDSISSDDNSLTLYIRSTLPIDSNMLDYESEALSNKLGLNVTYESVGREYDFYLKFPLKEQNIENK